MMFGFILVNLVNRNCCMDDLRLDSLFLNYWLNGLEAEKISSFPHKIKQYGPLHLMNMVMNVLSCNDRGN